MKKFIDITLLKYLAIFYTVFYGLHFVKCVYLDFFRLDRFNSLTELFFYVYFFDWLFVLVFMMLISLLTKKMFDMGFDWKRIIVVHLMLSVAIGYFVNILSGLVMYSVGGYSWQNSVVYNLTISRYFRLIDSNFLIYFSMAGIINVYYYIQKVKNIEVQKFQLRTQLADTKLKALKSQLHPHFIFNTLNSISSLMDIDIEKSQNLVAQFGDLLREILEFKDEDVVALREEINLLYKYIDILLIRFSDHLEVEKNIAKHLYPALVPNMILQPLFENFIKHGYSYNHTELKITITVFEKDKQLNIILENNGKLLDASFDVLLKKGIGLSNINDRLITLYKNDFTFDVKNKEDKSGVEAKLIFPVSFEKKEA